MKHLLTEITAFTLAFFVLFSTLSFTVDKHYCGEFLVDVSFTGEATGCGMEMDSKATTKKKNCCKDETLKIEGQEELQLTSFDKITFENQQFLTAFVFSYQNLFVEQYKTQDDQRIFPPPEIHQNYQVIYQSFLI